MTDALCYSATDLFAAGLQITKSVMLLVWIETLERGEQMFGNTMILKKVWSERSMS
jgi:hypothetical protein